MVRPRCGKLHLDGVGSQSGVDDSANTILPWFGR